MTPFESVLDQTSNQICFPVRRFVSSEHRACGKGKEWSGGRDPHGCRPMPCVVRLSASQHDEIECLVLWQEFYVGFFYGIWRQAAWTSCYDDSDVAISLGQHSGAVQ